MMNIKIFLSHCFCGLLLGACSTAPQPITVGKDACSFCKMSVVDKRYGAELITKKGKVYKFDDMHCLIAFRKSGSILNQDLQCMYIVNFDAPHELMELKDALLFKSELLRSPMGSNISGFKTKQALQSAAETFKGETVPLQQLIPGE
ncbi:nitrous oxide reductase accessory protein NosL [Pedobacter sp. AW31-3R]|uniref:nitrous oxide reductase accessory protein NosL n=1 Tax=Pedobacter sp. AW31-3R TaxID=3445781 RepID=UPI003FA0B2E8